MANNIDLAKVYAPMLDEVYKQASLTNMLDTAQELIREGYNANEIIVPKIDMDGLANYTRNSGYVTGDVTLVWETVKAEFDRGRKFSVDDLDNIETGGIVFGRLSGEFIRTKVVPELDAYRFAKYASAKDVSKAYGDLATGIDVVAALRAGTTQMDEDEVPMENRILYITPTNSGLVDDLDTTKSRAVLARFTTVVLVPQTRFYTAITQLDGKTSGQEKGGYKKADKASELNFIIIHPSAVIQANKLVKPKILPPEVNPDGDDWVYGYRLVSYASVYENKAAGIYAHIAGTAPVNGK